MINAIFFHPKSKYQTPMALQWPFEVSDIGHYDSAISTVFKPTKDAP